MSTKVRKPLIPRKHNVESYEFKLHDNAFECTMKDNTKLSEPWTETVTMEEVKDFVANENGQVDASFATPTGQIHKQFIEFDYYMSHEFPREAKKVLTCILAIREKSKVYSRIKTVCHD